MAENFKIDNDKTADWAISQIKEAEAERDRLVSLAEEQIKDLTIRIEEIKTKCENDTRYLRSLLNMYFDTVNAKETKTQKSYKLLAGTLVLKKPTVKINHDDDQLLAYLQSNGGENYIKTKYSVDWAEYKKNLGVEGDKVIDLDTGEVIEACSVENVPETFSIKF